MGSGKSTYAAELSETSGAPRLNLDDWMATLFSADRPSYGSVEWYLDRKDRCIEQIWKIACEITKSGGDVILELGLIQRVSREQLYEKVDAAGVGLTVYVLEAPLEVRRSRVQTRNITRGETYSMDVPEEFFSRASNLWESPDDDECIARDVRFISTGSADDSTDT